MNSIQNSPLQINKYSYNVSCKGAETEKLTKAYMDFVSKMAEKGIATEKPKLSMKNLILQKLDFTIDKLIFLRNYPFYKWMAKSSAELLQKKTQQKLGKQVGNISK